MQVNGFVVVRIPTMNFLVPGRDVVPCVNGIYYAGVDRNRWADVMDDDYYEGKLPRNVKSDLARLKRNDFSGIDLCQDIAVASRLLTYSNRSSLRNELIVIRSPSLAALKGCVETELAVEWVGFDVFALGEWSLISHGIFLHPDKYPDWRVQLNCHGLFNDPSLTSPYSLAYEEAVARGYSEPIAPKSSGLGILSVEIGRVRLN